MKAAILGKKVGMTQVYDEAGVLHPVTVVQAGPCNVLQVKTVASDGYDAVQIGFDDVKPQRAVAPAIGHAAKAGCKPKRHIREMRLTDPAGDVQPGQAITVEAFSGVAFVDVIGTTKGKGFAGVMKRHNFKGQPASHGCERKHRSPGAISSHSSNRGTGGKPKRGKKMAGHMGDARCTTRNIRVVRVDSENNLLLVKGALPGANGGLVFIRVSKTAKVATAPAQ
jgi:large subunit ribosomal protein L3